LILTKACLVSLCENQVLLFILLAGGGYRDRLGQIGQCIAKKELASTNQNPRIEWRREAPPLDSWVLYPKQNLLCYIT
jgi:hypothetical protein